MNTRAPTPDILGDIMGGAVAAAPTSTLLALSAITNDGGTQMRAGMDAATITEYTEVLTASAAWPFPPVVVYYDGEKYWLADGFHRVNAAHRSGCYVQIPAEVKPGTRRDAILHAAGANASHGLRRTNGDKRRAVEMLLRDPEWSQWSDGEISRRCMVSDRFVANVRKELTPNGSESTLRKGADGRLYNTAKIGTSLESRLAKVVRSEADSPARLFIDDLKGLVAKWMGQHWQHAWPDNPSHTNGEFWQSLTAWMHENVRKTWQEGDLKEAIKSVHAQSMSERLRRTAESPSLSAPTERQQQVAMLAVWELEKVAREVCKEVYGAQPQPFALSDMRQGARMRQGRFWLLCVKTINADNWRHADLAQAINNVAEQMAQKAPAPATETPAAPATDVHQGAGHTPPPPLTVEELREELTPHLQQVAVVSISNAADGMQNNVMGICTGVLADFTYSTGDLHRALQRIAIERRAAEMQAPPMVTEAARFDVNDDRQWALRSMENKIDGIIRQLVALSKEYGDLTGLHGDVLDARRKLEYMRLALQRNMGLDVAAAPEKKGSDHE